MARLSGAGKKKHYMVWTPFQQYVAPITFNKLNEARIYAKEQSEKNPGLAYYVLVAIKVFEVNKTAAVERDLID